MKSLSEAQLVFQVEDWLKGLGYETRLELRWRHGASTDLVARRNGEHVAIEVKVRNWRRALEQAVIQGTAFDKVYIAAKFSPNSKVLQDILEDSCAWSNWVGVLAIEGSQVRVLREGKPKPGFVCQHHRSLVRLLFSITDREGQVPFFPKKHIS